MPIRWTSDRMNQLERAALERKRVVVERRGTEFVVVALAVRAGVRGDVLVGRLPMTGEAIEFALAELDAVSILD